MYCTYREVYVSLKDNLMETYSISKKEQDVTSTWRVPLAQILFNQFLITRIIHIVESLDDIDNK